MRHRARLAQQQYAAETGAPASHANIAEQGGKLTFRRAVVVDCEANLHIGLDVAAVCAASLAPRLLLPLKPAGRGFAQVDAQRLIP